MFTQRFGSGFVFFTLIACATEMSGKVAADPPIMPQWEQMLWWLPEDTETLIVAQERFPFREPSPESKDSKDLPKIELADPAKPTVKQPNAKPANAPSRLEELVQGLMSGSVVGERKDVNLDLSGLKITCAIEGSRCFTPPKRFGLFPFQGCQILKFESGAEATLRKSFANCLAKAENKKEIVGQQVAIYTVKPTNPFIVEDVWTYYICQPNPGILLFATHQGYLEDTLKRIQTKPERRALPPTLLEWKHVDTKARIWALRHYNVKTAKNDLTSPLNSGKAAVGLDHAAVGFVFWFNADGSNRAYCRYLSGPDTDVVSLANRAWQLPSEELTPKVKKIGPGVAEIVADVSEERPTNSFLFVLLDWLGHAVCL